MRQALGETQFIQETKQFLTENGIALDSFGQVRAPKSFVADDHLCLLEFVRLRDVPLVEFMYLVLTRMPGESFRQQLRCLLLCLCYVFRVLVCWFWRLKVCLVWVLKSVAKFLCVCFHLK